jgi:hypothetical protein
VRLEDAERVALDVAGGLQLLVIGDRFTEYPCGCDLAAWNGDPETGCLDGPPLR